MPLYEKCYRPDSDAAHCNLVSLVTCTCRLQTKRYLDQGFILVPMSGLAITYAISDQTFPSAAVPYKLPNQKLPKVPNTDKEKPAVTTAYRDFGTGSSSAPPEDASTASSPDSSRRHSYTASSSTTLAPSLHSEGSLADDQRPSTAGSVSNGRATYRSTSDRLVSSSKLNSYVASLRKQKATVWCFRPQSTEARAAVQQKGPQKGISLEVVGAKPRRTGALSSNSMIDKLRHGSVPKAAGCTSPNMAGMNLPTRLLALDTQGKDESERRVPSKNHMTHSRTVSDQSGIRNDRYRSGYRRTRSMSVKSGSPVHEEIVEAIETPRPEQDQEVYHDARESAGTGSGDSTKSLQEVTEPSPKRQPLRRKAGEEVLRRRGSIDERIAAMPTTQRLFVTNPDIDQVH